MGMNIPSRERKMFKEPCHSQPSAPSCKPRKRLLALAKGRRDYNKGRIQVGLASFFGSQGQRVLCAILLGSSCLLPEAVPPTPTGCIGESCCVLLWLPPANRHLSTRLDSWCCWAVSNSCLPHGYSLFSTAFSLLFSKRR